MRVGLMSCLHGAVSSIDLAGCSHTCSVEVEDIYSPPLYVCKLTLQLAILLLKGSVYPVCSGFMSALVGLFCCVVKTDDDPIIILLC